MINIVNTNVLQGQISIVEYVWRR